MLNRYFRFTLQVVGAVTLVAVIIGICIFAVLPNWLQYEDQPVKADYIVPLAGRYERVLVASDLYRQGYAPTLLVGRERVRPANRISNLITEFGYPQIDPRELRLRLLERGGVPKDAVAEFGESLVSTIEEAEALRRHIGDREFSAIIVTSRFHARRAKMIFESVIPKGRFWIVVTPEGGIERQFWRDQDSSLLVLNETAKIVHFLLGGAFRHSGQTNSR